MERNRVSSYLFFFKTCFDKAISYVNDWPDRLLPGRGAEKGVHAGEENREGVGWGREA